MPSISSTSGAAVSRRADRLCYGVTVKTLHDGYTSYHVNDRVRVPSLEGAVLVSSETERRTHAPALDLDLPAALVPTALGVDLWVDVPSSRWRHRRLLRELQRAGLLAGEVTPRNELSAARRQEQWAEALGNVLDDSARQETLRTLGPELTVSFDAAVLVATQTSAPPRRGEGPPMSSPWRIPLACEAMLVPSTSNSHLYLDVELAWDTYRSLLLALKRARVVEKGYVKASLDRRGTHLRLPWVSKDREL